MKRNTSGYRSSLLVLSMLTNTVTVAISSMCMPVLFSEISKDLNFSLVEVGLLWGISALPGVLTFLVGGAFGDRFGPRRVLIVACILSGVTGALRGAADGFGSMLVAMCLYGLVSPAVNMNTLKACGVAFPRRQLGLASGVLSVGMALGFLSASMFSATWLSPWLGGWRNVLFLYGAVSVAFAIPWCFVRITPAQEEDRATAAPAQQASFRQAFSRVARIPAVWWFGLIILGFGGCIQGILGFLPLYLRGQGWAGPAADGALAAFHTVSLVCAIPIALGSDRLGSRTKVLAACGLMIALGGGLLSFVSGSWVWVAVCIAGMTRDGFMAVFMAAIIETEGVGPVFAGTAIGLVMVFSGLGSLLAPPIGNSLADVGQGLPFVFWSALTLVGFAGLLAMRAWKPRPGLAA
jgi:MFS family permease